MVQFFDSIPQNVLRWIQEQHLFWVATAPLSIDGHVNVSPKGAFDCFHIINPNKVWYEDLTGSGSETIAHLRENKRITVMFTAFDGPPRIVRLFGRGTSFEYGTPEYEELLPIERRKPGSRAVIVVDIHKVSSSCGFSVPFYEFKGERTLLLERMAAREAKADKSTANTREDKGLREYWATTNAKSIDGLPGVVTAPYSLNTPSNRWTREDEIERSNKKVAAKRRDSTGIRAIWAADGAKLVAAFVSGILLTLSFVRATHLLSVYT